MCKSVKIRQDYGHSLSPHFFGSPCLISYQVTRAALLAGSGALIVLGADSVGAIAPTAYNRWGVFQIIMDAIIFAPPVSDGQLF